VNPLVALLAVVFERVFGYPQSLVDRIGHPVIWIGWAIGQGDQQFNTASRSPSERRTLGIALMVGLCGAILVFTLFFSAALRALPLGWMAEAAIASSLLAQKELGRAVRAVATGLRQSLAAGREAVSHIVGRDTTDIDEPAVARAAIETLAENASDGVVAPLFYLVLFGLPGIAVYKAINTADSMIGHLDDRYADFGWAAAKIDDIANFIPARLTALLFALAASITPGADYAAAMATARRDAAKHASPNAGWPEAAMAGALGFGLGGPRSYDGETVDLPTMGDGRRALGPDDIETALTLYERMLWVMTGGLVICVMFVMAA